MRSYTFLLSVSGWVALAATALPPLSVPRVLVTLLFIAVCPGLAAVRLAGSVRPAAAGGREPLLTAVIAVSSSLALTTLVSEFLLLAGVFTMPRCLAALATLTALLAVTPDAVRRRRRVS